MKNQVIVLIAFFSVVLFLSSCQKDNPTDNPLELFAQEQNETHQGNKRTCGHSEHMHELLSNPNYKKIHDEKRQKLEEAAAQGLKADCSNPKVIPVAVHFQNTNNTNLTCLRALAQAQIDILNQDFGGTNSDLSNWTNEAAGYFPGVSNGEACFVFCLADKNHPNGFGLSNGQTAVTMNQTSGDNSSAWNGYLNFYVRPNTGYLGYAPLGGSGNGDGVVIDASAFGAGTSCGNVGAAAPYDLGRTVTHELGHYLYLDHIWGNGCATDDDVSDTPDQASDHSGCPSLQTSSCGSRDLHMNYMDYVNDACMYMFSAGQVTRMENYVNGNLSNLTNNAANKCSNVSGGSDNGGDTGSGDDNGDDDGDDTTPQTCGKPTEGSVQNLSPNKVKVTWEAVPNATYYRIRYRKVGTTAWKVRASSNPVRTLFSLTANATYQYQLKSKCPNGWTAYSSAFTFNTGGNTGGSDCNGTEVTIKVVLDQYGSETSWELINDNDNEVATGGSYSDNQEGAVKTTDLCLPEGCYTLYLDDAYGDGICCDYGDGYLQVISGGQVVGESDGYFGYYDVIDFCVDSNGLRIENQSKDQKATNLAPKTVLFSN